MTGGGLAAIGRGLAIIGLTFAARSVAADRPMIGADAYRRAELLSPQNLGRLAWNLDVRPTWIAGSDALWFKVADAGGERFEVADLVAGTARPAFDTARMADTLASAAGKPASAIASIDYPRGLGGPVRVATAGGRFDCDEAATRCAAVALDDPLLAKSPNGRFAVFAKGDDLWVRDLSTGAERALTTDGSAHRGYGVLAETFAPVTSKRMGLASAPVGAFSPDGSKFLTYQLDESGVEPVHLLQYLPEDGSVQPKVWTYREPFHSAAPATGALVVIDLASGRATRLEHPPSPTRFDYPMALEQVAWNADGRSVLFVDFSRDLLTKTLFRADAATGRVTPLIVEHAATSEANSDVPDFKLTASNKILWPSERDGWSHVYLYTPDGRLVRQLTRGAWAVRDIVGVDERRRLIYVLAGGLHPGEDPYLRHLARVGFDGRDLRDLTPEDADHEITTIAPGPPLAREHARYGGFSADGRFFVDAYSRVDRPTITVVRDAEGKVLRTLAEAKLTPLGQSVYTPPEPFKVMADDGVTPLYGVIMLGRDFDPARRYPVIDSEYDGPQAATSPKRYLWDVLTGYHSSRPMAELGFVVVDMDARGKPGRSRAFWDYGYGHLGRGGLPDRLAMLRQLGAVHLWMDTSRIGVYGYSAGGFAAVHAIVDAPEVYKVGVAISPYALMYQPWNWGQTWQGPYDLDGDAAQEPWVNAAQFRGKLLMMVGDVDDVVHPASVMRIADALTKAGKTYDMLVVPNGDHQMIVRPDLQRRVWDYFVRNLAGAEPPADKDKTP